MKIFSLIQMRFSKFIIIKPLKPSGSYTYHKV